VLSLPKTGYYEKRVNERAQISLAATYLTDPGEPEGIFGYLHLTNSLGLGLGVDYFPRPQ
jgi:hypothetical protein